LRLPNGLTRQYSLCGDPDDDTVYKIAVKREDDGRGGSRWVHENLHTGSIVPISAPRNNFPLAMDARRHVFIAGGIGITPILPMATHLARADIPFHLHYCAHTLGNAPFLPELAEVCGPRRLSTYIPDARDPRRGRLNVEQTIKALTPGTHIYCCGPQRLTQAVRDAAINWPPNYVHSEVFKATLDENFVPEPFDVKIASSGKVFRVPANKSALDVLRAEGFGLPSSCELGVCGSCECRYLDGTVIHRDSVLDITARQDRMMLCVSRARVSVTLDL
jgi:ferredoxin-NADP reductase